MTDRSGIEGGRRAFFRKLFGLGVAAGAGAWVARRGAAPPSPQAQASAAPASATAYRETEHIRKVYRSARG